MYLFAVQKMPRLTTIENMMRISQMVVQGLWDTKSPLLQLPHVTEDMLKYFSSKKVSLVSQNSIYLNLPSFKAKTDVVAKHSKHQRFCAHARRRPTNNATQPGALRIQ